MDPRIQQIIRMIPLLRDGPVVVTPLEGGLTNRNLLLTRNEHRLVLRLAGENSSLLGINRHTEHRCACTAASAGIGAEVIAFFPEHEALVTRFLEGPVLTPDDVRRPATLRRVVSSLRRFHEGSPVPGRFCVFETVRSYYQLAQARPVVFPSELAGALETFARIERDLESEDLRWPCHNDLLPSNFVDDGATVRILDWEYSGMGDRFFDLGNLAANNLFEDAEESMLLELYFGEIRPGHQPRLRRMRLASDLREAMWGFLQTGISTLAFDYGDYGRRHLERFLARSQR